MPKKVDYPRGSLNNCLQLAVAVDDLGGDCSIDLAADKLGKKVSGAFRALIGATTKYDFIRNKQGRLTTTTLYRNYKLAYSPEEQNGYLTQAFLNPGIFQEVYNRFLGSKLPVDHFEKLLIREFDVPENLSSRVSKYFLAGAKQCGLLDDENKLVAANNLSIPHDSDTNEQFFEVPTENENVILERLTEEFSVHIFGPGIDSKIAIKDEADLMIVDAMLMKVRSQVKNFKESDEDDSSIYE